MPKSIKQRKSKYFDGQKALGRITRGVSATPDEHDEIKACLASSRYDGLDWYECDVSGHLRAIGDKGEYWIMECNDRELVGVSIVNPTPAGPSISFIVWERSVKEARAFAEEYDAKP